mmetsp:Transcript_23410/g.55472  ORF Transcript_23410/g.55472 Transcript_23410/m.55472 type:complete len:280 (+) Transcript_23410:167-1006(+)
MVWRPILQESVDGERLVTHVKDLWMTDFPYDRLPTTWLQYFLRPEYVLGLLIFYAFVSKPLTKGLTKILVPNPKASWFIASIAIHNLVLAIFSGVVAYNTWPILWQHYQQYGFFDMYCDPNSQLWNQPSGFGPWATIFYVSKYWEFVDTWILVLKQKQPSFLQVYHHTGIAFCMWVGVVSQSSWLQSVVTLNSVIHTLMYTYFFIKTIWPTIDIPQAKYLTKAQIGQFFTGIFYSAGVLVMGSKCDTQSSRFGLACLQVYGYGLVALFMAFASRKYKKK